MQYFDRNGCFFKKEMLGLIYAAKCATADFTNHTVVANLLANEAVYVSHNALPRKLHLYSCCVNRIGPKPSIDVFSHEPRGLKPSGLSLPLRTSLTASREAT